MARDGRTTIKHRRSDGLPGVGVLVVLGQAYFDRAAALDHAQGVGADVLHLGRLIFGRGIFRTGTGQQTA